MPIYFGLFLIAFASLSVEISLSRLLSVMTWYHLAFFAVSTAMLGMTAGATTVYLKPERFSRERLADSAAKACLGYAGSIPVMLLILCRIPFDTGSPAQRMLQMALATIACALPFYFAGIVISAILTKSPLSISRLYGSDLIGAALGCLFVLGGLAFFDAPSFILFCGGLGAVAALSFAWRSASARLRQLCYAVGGVLIVAALFNQSTQALIRPLYVKGSAEDASNFLSEEWNSFSRVVVYNQENTSLEYWGPSPLAPQNLLPQYQMNIDGAAGTSVRQFSSLADIEHLKYDVTNMVYYLRPQGAAAVIGVGGGRDLQSAILFGHEQVTGIELNPIFVDLLQTRFREFAGLADRPGVSFVVDEARSYLSRTDQRYTTIQMSLIDTWASTGAGAYSLSENGLYTVEAWQVFLDRLTDDGIFTVSRWYSADNVNETGRVVSLAVATLQKYGITDPARHIALIGSGKVSTLLLSRQPFTDQDIAQLHKVTTDLQYKLLIVPGTPAETPVLRNILGATSLEELFAVVRDEPLNYTPTTDENPYFFNMLRLDRMDVALNKTTADNGVIDGNLTATLTLVGLIICLLIFAVMTIVLPLILKARNTSEASTTIVWSAAAYFSLIGAGFMCVEIALMQRLSVFLGHPVYALGILLFTIIASTGVGSFFSERLPLTKKPWIFVMPIVTALAILGIRFGLSAIIAAMITAPMATKIMVSIILIFPLGLLLGLFFPTGMQLVRSSGATETPWYWALNGIFGVLCSASAVLISIYFTISVNFYIGVACYSLLVLCLRHMRQVNLGNPSSV
ncbi:spermidine synthase family protein [Herpetosiphon geysericola]|uniref:Spermidine synthase n=1 Tax=Herpetosiphon geysericola TaxID=70996 RepID=A0A0P6Y2R9_9CHLR|nr:hypothetical protein [Herpetosiphon geysericola]KPL90153.1 hypothetical protein SE18_08055 [Herpetosiphon geysericola]